MGGFLFANCKLFLDSSVDSVPTQSGDNDFDTGVYSRRLNCSEMNSLVNENLLIMLKRPQNDGGDEGFYPSKELFSAIFPTRVGEKGAVIDRIVIA